MAFNPLLISATAIGITLVYASVLDLRSRRVPVPTWYPMLAIGVPSTLWFYTTQFAVAPNYALLLLVLSVALAVAFYLFGRFNMIGGADVRALAFVTLLLPTFPFTPLLGESRAGVLSPPDARPRRDCGPARAAGRLSYGTGAAASTDPSPPGSGDTRSRRTRSRGDVPSAS